MFGNYYIADYIAIQFSSIDYTCRQELEKGIIVSERDYVSTLATRVRDHLKIQQKVTCLTQTIRPRQENENGVDAIIVFKYRNTIKVGLFEAKRPQFKIRNYAWDYLSDRNISHFSEQIKNQHRWEGDFAIWEMFVNENSSGVNSPPLDCFGSSCVWHKNAYDFMNKEALIFNTWTTDKLKLLLSRDGRNIYTMIFDLLSCTAGKRIKINSKTMSARIGNSKDETIGMTIPIPRNQGEFDERIEGFLEENKIETYMFFDFTKLKKYSII